jgi:LuxR family transcriptional regulator, maltose regulon positive regulatory protein
MTVAAGGRPWAAAAGWAQERDAGADDGPASPWEWEYLGPARGLLAQDLAGAAVALLARLLATAARGRATSVVEARARQTLALAAGGEEARAALALAEGLTLGYLAGVLRAFDLKLAEPGTAVGAVPGLAEPLTSRERQVLGLLAAGQANRDIADGLVISLDTVKRHVTHILAKLGAANRTEAAARARHLNLIP